MNFRHRTIFAGAQSSQTTRSLADIVVSDSGTEPNLPIMNAPMSGRNPLLAMCVRWSLLAVMDWVSPSVLF